MISSIRGGDNYYSIRELSGGMGDFGTLIPLAAGYIMVCGLDPGSLLITVGAVTMVTGLVFRLPVPTEPMKVLAVVAIAQSWTPAMVYASAFAMGLTWLVLAGTGLIEILAKYTPQPVIRGIQAALGIMLAIQAYTLLSSWWLLGLAALALALLLRKNRYAPSILILIAAGIMLSFYRGATLDMMTFGFTLPTFTTFSISDLWPVMLLGGFAQIPLTATNAVLSTASLMKTYWPDRVIKPRRLAMSIGLINLALPFVGGMPICHGAGGLAAKHYFGARTGGANISIGIVEIVCGLFLATSVGVILTYFPEAIIGAMLLLVGFELVKFAGDISFGWETAPLAATIVVSVLVNMAFGFLAGIALYYFIKHFQHIRDGDTN